MRDEKCTLIEKDETAAFYTVIAVLCGSVAFVLCSCALLDFLIQ